MQPQKTQLRKPVKPDSVIRKYFIQRSGEKSLTMERQVKRWTQMIEWYRSGRVIQTEILGWKLFPFWQLVGNERRCWGEEKWRMRALIPHNPLLSPVGHQLCAPLSLSLSFCIGLFWKFQRVLARRWRRVPPRNVTSYGRQMRTGTDWRTDLLHTDPELPTKY